MATDTYRIMPGACGWLHEAWKESYYPEDLPIEWQLGYYGNEFSVVMLPSDYWKFDDTTIQDWLGDSGDSLKIVCEFTSLAQLQSNQQRLALFGSRCSGIVCKVNIADFSVEDMAILQAVGLPVCVDIGGDEQALGLELQSQLIAHHIGLVWHGVNVPPEFHHCPLVLTRVNSQDMDMRKLRQVVETLLSQTDPEQTVVVIFDGEPPDIATINNTVVMLDLVD